MSEFIRKLVADIERFSKSEVTWAHKWRVYGLIFITLIIWKVSVNPNWSWGIVFGGWIFAIFYYSLITVFADVFTDKFRHKDYME